MPSHNIFDPSRVKHTPVLFWLAVLSILGALTLVPFWILDARELGGVSAWEKPLKFFISSAIFSITYSWLSSFISKGARWVKLAGLFIAVSLAVELVLILAMAIQGTTSHFNVSSPTSIIVWSLMATFISIVLSSTVLLSIMILLQKHEDFKLKLALGLGSLNTSIGMGLAYLMTWPTATQLANYQGIAGAHSVGVSDGGPGLPFFGWSTVAGDLRVGHFFGLHSIQVAVILLAATLVLPNAFRVPVLFAGNVTWLGFVCLVTWQSLRAEPFSAPSELTLAAFGALLVVGVILFFILVGSRRLGKSKSLT